MKDKPAFPIYPRSEGLKVTEFADGLGISVRQYYAAHALQGYLAYTDKFKPDEVAKMSFLYADAVLEAEND